MKISPQLVKIAYGTLVISGMGITGTLWYLRTGHKKVNLVDYIEVYQSALERCMATEDADYYSAYAWSPSVRTNLVMSWSNSSSMSYSTYPTNSTNAVSTNYWTALGYTDQDLWTNHFNHRYRVALPSTDTRELTGGAARYIWNAYSNLVIAGFADATYNGTYVLATNGTTFDLQAWALTTLSMTIMDEVGQSANVHCFVYSNSISPNAWLFDFGPLDSAGKVASPYTDLRSAVIWDNGWWSRAAFTYRGDSPLNGPWFLDSDLAPLTNVTVTGSGFSSNLLVEAFCRWYAGKKTEHAIYDGVSAWFSWDNVAPAYSDPRYWVPDRHAIGPKVHKGQLDAILSTISNLALSYVESGGRETGSRYVRTNSAVAGEFVGFTNIQSFYDLSTQYTFAAACGWAGVPATWTNHAIPATSDVTRIAKLLQEFQWTRRGRSFGDLPYIYNHRWYLPGKSTGTSSTVTNYWTGSGQSATSWAEAKANAEAAFAPYDDTVVWGPFQFSQGYYSTGGGSEVWMADVYACEVELCYPGACTSITHEVDFYVLGTNPPFGTGANTFDDNGAGLTNTYKRIGSATNNLAYPYITVGSTNLPNWCDDPKPATPVEDQAYYLRRGYGVAEPEIIMKWNWQYNTNVIAGE